MSILFFIHVCIMLLLFAFTNDVRYKLMKYIEYEKNSENVLIKASVEWQKFHSFLIKDVISHQRWFYKTDDSFVCVLQRIVSRKNKFDFSLYFWVICTTFHHYMTLVKYFRTTWNFFKWLLYLSKKYINYGDAFTPTTKSICQY